MEPARELWKRIETLNAVTYFAPESTAATKSAGLKGFWMGYFGFRAAPLGPASAGVVDAAFANFAPAMVRRSIPDAWTFADPAALIRSRSESAADALRRLAPEVSQVALEINDTLRSIIEASAPIGRPLFAANRDVAPIDDPVAQLWQHCTTIREHRGDGHVAALAAAGIDGCEAHQLFIAANGLPDDVFRTNRGWSEDEWDAAKARLRTRGLLEDAGLTDAGRRTHDHIEAVTDALAAEPLEAALEADRTDQLIAQLTSVAVQVASSGVLPFPNPMGLPEVNTAQR